MDFELTGDTKNGVGIRVFPSRYSAEKGFWEKSIRKDKTEVTGIRIDDIQIILIKAGRGHVQVNSEISGPWITAYGTLNGDIRSENASGEITYFHLAPGQHNLFYPAGLIRTLLLEAPLRAFIIFLSETYLRGLLQEDSGASSFLLKHIRNRKAFITDTLPVNARIYHIIDTLSANVQKASIKRIFIQAKILELLSAQLEQFDAVYKQDPSSSFLKSRDIDKIYLAKTFIEENMQTPCSLIELSRKVGLNDFKLKKGFKEIFGSTVFNYLTDFRMERAMLLLKQKKTVSEVASEVGYKNPQHFTVAFKKKFGILPSNMNRS